MRSPGGWRTQFLILAATWGSSFLFIKVLSRQWPAVWVAFGRVALGAATLGLLLVIRNERLRFDRRLWLDLIVTAVLFNVVPFTLFAFGEKHVSSVIAGLWNATTPLWVLTGSLLAFDDEHPSRSRIAGIGTGFIGVVMLLGPWRGLGGGQLEGHLACAGGALCYGAGFLYTRRHLAGRAISGVALSAGQLLCATVMLAAIVPFTGGPTTHIGLDGLGSLLALGVLGTGIAYVLNYAIVRAAGATVASTVTYLIPVFSTLLGVIVLGEQLSWNEPTGAVILLVGIAISQGQISELGAGAGSAERGRPGLT